VLSSRAASADDGNVVVLLVLVVLPLVIAFVLGLRLEAW